MKKHLILILALFTVLVGFTQNRTVIAKELRNKSLKDAPAITETGNLKGEVKEFSTTKDYEAYIIGNTYYDLQTNVSCQNRMYLYDDGKIGATFTYGLNFLAFTDRGTGYNYFNGIDWGPFPVQRIESDRTGWPSYSPWGPDGEINVAHYSGAAIGGLAIYERPAKGSGAWSSYILHGPITNAELLWPRSTTGDVDHSILHVVALTMPVANGGVVYQGQDGALVYSRSSNGGQTWEVQNSIISGLGSAFYTGFQGDTYEIIANDNNVSILIGDDWMGLILLKSTDNGNNWTKTTIWDHPYPLWDPNNQFPTDTFYCVDGSHTIAYDNTGKIHVAFGINRAYSDGTTQYWFPLVDGVGYWNEDMSAFSDDMNALSPYGDPGSELIEDYNLIGWMQDVNGNGTLDILGEPGLYYGGTSSMPQLVIDEQNNVFVIYSSVTETYNNGIQDYRHLWGRGSNNDGQTWGEFVDLNYDLIYIFSECVFPSCSPTSDGNIHLVFQMDNEPGLAVRGDLDPYSENYIEYLKISKSDFIYVPNIGTLSGIVTKLTGGSPIQGATITIEGTAYTTTSNYAGQYSIAGIPVGNYTVHCSKTGYYSQTAPVTINDNQVSTKNFQLAEIVIPGDQGIGSTYYDNQSNSGMQNRIYLYPDGFIGATFIYGSSFPAFPDRGTGYNSFSGTSWGPIPTQKIEPDRAGWPSYLPCGANGEMVISHYSGGSLSGNLAISKRTSKGTGTWVTTDFSPPIGAYGLLWPRAVSGGTVYNSIHLIALTTPIANGGNIYQGQDGALLYSRSLNGGQTWDIQNTVITDIGVNYYNGFSADEYEFAEPKGNTIAMLVGSEWTDLILLKSNDNGSTWSKTIVWQHPYPQWNGQPTDTFYCPDGAHAIALDNSGKVHIAFGITKTNCDESGIYYWYPEVGGIGYWNEDMPSFSNNLNALNPYGGAGSELIQDYNLIGWEQDVNNNGTWDVLGDFGTYYVGSSSQPQLVLDEDDNIFLFFSSVTETFNNGIQDYRHIWARGFAESEQTWGSFADVTANYLYSECVFPSCAPLTNGNIHLIFQRDNEPGMAVRGDSDPYDENSIEYLSINSSQLLSPSINGNLEGTVTDAQTGNPVQGAMIQLEGTAYSATTIVNGFYSITGIIPGVYTASCSKVGYSTVTTTVNITQNNTTINNFQLELFNLNPPQELTGTIINNDLLLQWQPPSGGGVGEWIQWDAGVNNGNGIGLTNGGTFYVASHWTQADLASYYGMSLSKISFFPNGDPIAIYQLYVWKGPNAVNQIMTQPVGSFIVDQWNEVTLNSPVLINSGDELWFGYSVTHNPGTWPAGCDDGPAISERGDMISMDGVVWNSMGITYGLDYNWNLAGFVESTDKTISEKPMVKTIINPAPSSFIASKDFGKQSGIPVKFNPSTGKAFLGYRVYKNSQFLAFTINTYYLEEDLVWGSYIYYVTALYDEGESVPSNSFWIVGPEPCGSPVNVIATVVNQNDIEVTWEPPLTGTPLGYNLYRDYTLIAYSTTLSYTEPNAEPGTYNYCVSAVCFDGESELACADPVTIYYLAPPTDFQAYIFEFTFIEMDWNPPGNKSLLGYNLYCAHNDTIFDSVNFFTENYGYYIAEELGWFTFYVTALYNEGESQPSNTSSVLITSTVDFFMDILNIYPNPADNELYIDAGDIIRSIRLYNSFGQFITDRIVNDKNCNFNVSGYNQGIYFLQMQFDKGIAVRRIVIE